MRYISLLFITVALATLTTGRTSRAENVTTTSSNVTSMKAEVSSPRSTTEASTQPAATSSPQPIASQPPTPVPTSAPASTLPTNLVSKPITSTAKPVSVATTTTTTLRSVVALEASSPPSAPSTIQPSTQVQPSGGDNSTAVKPEPSKLPSTGARGHTMESAAQMTDKPVAVGLEEPLKSPLIGNESKTTTNKPSELTSTKPPIPRAALAVSEGTEGASVFIIVLGIMGLSAAVVFGVYRRKSRRPRYTIGQA